MKDRISNLKLLSAKIAKELVVIRAESNRSDLSKTAKESMIENVHKITTRLKTIDALLAEMIYFSGQENINLAYHERKLIVGTLRRHNGSRIRSAKDLKISEKSVRNKIIKYKIVASEYRTMKSHEGRKALCVDYKEDYNQLISYINKHNTFWLKDLRGHMGYKKYYSPATHLVDYLRTKNLIDCEKTIGREIKYIAVRVIVAEDLSFVYGNGCRVAKMA